MTTEPVGTVSEKGVAGIPQAKEGLQNPRLQQIGGILAIVIPAIIWFSPLGLEPQIQKVAAITVFMLIAWMTEVLDPALVGLIGCYLFWALGVVRFDMAFSGFANDTPWFVMAALFIGAMATKSGLGRRLAYSMMSLAGKSYSQILLWLIVTDFLMTLIVPSAIARIVIMLAAAIGLADALGMGRGTNVGKGMFLVITYTATIFDKMIIAGAAAITARGLIERFGEVQVLWSYWLAAYFPCVIITILVAWRLTLWFYPPEKQILSGGSEFFRQELARMGPWTSMEKRCLALILIGLGLWLTDFLHHQSPSLVGIAVGLAATLPGLRLLTIEDIKKVNYLPVFFVAAAISMANVLVSTKTLDLLTNVIFAWMTPLIQGVYSASLVLYWTAFAYHFFLASEISMLSTSIPLLMDFAHTHGFNPLALGMIWTFAAGGKLFLYQSVILIIGHSYGYFTSRDLLRMGLAITIVESVVLLLLVPLYWPLIGISLR